NMYHFAQMVEEYIITERSKDVMMFNEQLNIVSNTVASFDFIIKSSVKNEKAMEILHCEEYANEKPKIVQAILDLANDAFANLSQQNSVLPEQSLLKVLFRLKLLIISNLSTKEITNANHLIRLMALLSRDLIHSKVPEPKFVTPDKDVD